MLAYVRFSDPYLRLLWEEVNNLFSKGLHEQKFFIGEEFSGQKEGGGDPVPN